MGTEPAARNGMNLLKVVAALGLSAAAAAVYAEKPAEKGPDKASVKRYFQALDLNGDGHVSLAEAAGDPVVVSRFDKGDRNRDGKLSEKEFANLSKVKLRVAKAKKGKEKEEEVSAAVGGSRPTRDERRRARTTKAAAETGG